MKRTLKIGTRDSALAIWQARLVQDLLSQNDVSSELIFIKSEGDVDLVTPLYELGVQGIFTKTLDAALLSGRIDLAVHSLKDVPTQPARGIVSAAVLKRASYLDIIVYKDDPSFLDNKDSQATIATSSVRRIAQWKHRFRRHEFTNLRGNVNTRLQRLKENSWSGAIFAAAGLERIDVRPSNSIDLDWMLPAPAQGAIVAVCQKDDGEVLEVCKSFHDEQTANCTNIERQFLRGLMGGCSTPISALAEAKNGRIEFRGNICSPDGVEKIEVEEQIDADDNEAGSRIAAELLKNSSVANLITKLHDKPA
jgi:hydroxymethylbilane synthase